MSTGEQLKQYSASFLNALRPIVLAATGSALEVDLARTYLSTQSGSAVLKVYRKQVETELNGRPIWHWVVLKNEQLLMDRPELLLGSDNSRIKAVAKGWVAALSAAQKATVWQWLIGGLAIGGYDVSEVVETQ